MMMRDCVALLLIVIIALFPFWFMDFSNNYVEKVEELPILKREPYRIKLKGIKVLSGHEFQLLIEKNEQLVHVNSRLRVKTISDAKDVVVELLQNTKNAEVLVYDDRQEYIVDVEFSKDDKMVSLENFLIQSNLTLLNE